MLDFSNFKEVDFEKWCPKCAHWKKDEEDDPCNICLGIGGNYGTTKPFKFEEEPE